MPTLGWGQTPTGTSPQKQDNELTGILPPVREHRNKPPFVSILLEKSPPSPGTSTSWSHHQLQLSGIVLIFRIIASTICRLQHDFPERRTKGCGVIGLFRRAVKPFFDPSRTRRTVPKSNLHAARINTHPTPRARAATIVIRQLPALDIRSLQRAGHGAYCCSRKAGFRGNRKGRFSVPPGICTPKPAARCVFLNSFHVKSYALRAVASTGRAYTRHTTPDRARLSAIAAAKITPQSRTRRDCHRCRCARIRHAPSEPLPRQVLPVHKPSKRNEKIA